MKTKKLLLLLSLALFCACGNYSLLEKLGPDGDTDYLPFREGKYWVYSGTLSELHEDPASVYITNIIARSSHFTNGSFLVLTNNYTENAGDSALKKVQYGYNHLINILASFSTNTWNTTAYPEIIELPYLTMPFVEGALSGVQKVQIISNYPLSLSSLPGNITVTYSVSNQILKNNLTLEINGVEYDRCVKLVHESSIRFTSHGDNSPYKSGDTIQTYQDTYVYYLAPSIGPIRIQHRTSELGQDNIYRESYYDGLLVETGLLW